MAKYPALSAADWPGLTPDEPRWAAAGAFRVRQRFVYDERLPFTWETWRGRMRACRGTGAALSPKDLARFDADHAALLERTTPEEFAVLHRMDMHLLEPVHG